MAWPSCRSRRPTTKATWKQLDIKKISATSAANDDLNSKAAAQVEIKRPLQRYLRAKLISKTANIAFGADVCPALRLGMRTPPPGDDDVIAAVVVASPSLKSS